MKTTKFEIKKMIGGQYAIVDTINNSNIVFGGDSACEDHYNLEFMQDVFDRWDGSLNEDGTLNYDCINFDTIR